jgi:hypothetical protein
LLAKQVYLLNKASMSLLGLLTLNSVPPCFVQSAKPKGTMPLDAQYMPNAVPAARWVILKPFATFSKAISTI